MPAWNRNTGNIGNLKMSYGCSSLRRVCRLAGQECKVPFRSYVLEIPNLHCIINVNPVGLSTRETELVKRVNSRRAHSSFWLSLSAFSASSSPLFTILTASLGRSIGPLGTFSIFSTTSKPSTTSPKTTWRPSSHLFELSAENAQRGPKRIMRRTVW